MSLWQLESVLDVPRNLPLKFRQNRVSNSWDILDMDKYHLDKCHQGSWNLFWMFLEAYIKSFIKLGCFFLSPSMCEKCVSSPFTFVRNVCPLREKQTVRLPGDRPTKHFIYIDFSHISSKCTPCLWSVAQVIFSKRFYQLYSNWSLKPGSKHLSENILKLFIDILKLVFQTFLYR